MYPLKARLPAPIYAVFRAVRAVLVALCFAGFWSGAVIVGWLWLPILELWPGSPADKMRRCHRTMRRGFAVFHAAMRVLRLYHRTSPVARVRPGATPVVLVANHPTLCDVTSIASLFPDVVAVARPGLADHPLLRPVVRRSGLVRSGTHVMRDCEDRLRMGFDVLVFPEGTRSPLGGPMHPFHRGAFELAARAQVPIVLLKLTCAPPALSKGLPFWRIADHMAVLTVEPIATLAPGARGAATKTRCREIEQRYREVLGYSAPAPVSGEVQ
jgi:1-acyl-sn-glycerol-3-phosphate acyltransferase